MAGVHNSKLMADREIFFLQYSRAKNKNVPVKLKPSAGHIGPSGRMLCLPAPGGQQVIAPKSKEVEVTLSSPSPLECHVLFEWPQSSCL